MVRKLCIRSLRRGIGSMDYIHSLLIAEDDDDDDDSDHETDGVESTAIASGSSVQTSIAASPPAKTLSWAPHQQQIYPGANVMCV